MRYRKRIISESHFVYGSIPLGTCTIQLAGDECFGTFLNRGGKQSIAKYAVKKNEWKHVTDHDIPSLDQLHSYGITADRDRVYIVGG